MDLLQFVLRIFFFLWSSTYIYYKTQKWKHIAIHENTIQNSKIAQLTISVQTLDYPHCKILLCNIKDTMCTIAWGSPQTSTPAATDSKPKPLHTFVSFSIKCNPRQNSDGRSRFPVSSNQSRRHSPEEQRHCKEVNSYRRNCSRQNHAYLLDAKSWLWHWRQ